MLFKVGRRYLNCGLIPKVYKWDKFHLHQAMYRCRVRERRECTIVLAFSVHQRGRLEILRSLLDVLVDLRQRLSKLQTCLALMDGLHGRDHCLMYDLGCLMLLGKLQRRRLRKMLRRLKSSIKSFYSITIFIMKITDDK